MPTSKSSKKKETGIVMEKIEKMYGKDFGTKDPEKVFDFLEKAGWPGLAAFLRGNNVKK